MNNTAASASEDYLHRIARESFLTLWSYPNLYRDQGINARKEGKELVDLAVVFEHTVILFSDKSCAFPHSDDLDRDWARWYRRAVKKSAEQLWGAERWIRDHPGRIFVDRRCKTRIPIRFPAADGMTVHRIVVARDATGLRARATGGSGSLIIRPSVEGDGHLRKGAEGGEPLAIGQVDSSRGLIHVLDEVSLDILLRTLDTITDLCRYLERKEGLISSGRLHGAAGEEDLLGFYLQDIGPDGHHDFVLPEGEGPVWIEEGNWDRYVHSPERAAQFEADRISYLWDDIIERFTLHALRGTYEFDSGQDLTEKELVFRLMARESRTRRRMLAEALVGKIKDTAASGLPLGFRVVLPSEKGEPVYVLVVATEVPEWTPEQYRDRRRMILNAYTRVARAKYPHHRYIIGLATEGADSMARSEDLLLLDAEDWTEEDQAEALEIQEERGWLKTPRFSGETIYDYPTRPRKRIKFGRNEPCPCGSGRKFKKCCGG